jgi:hypothetical protein
MATALISTSAELVLLNTKTRPGVVILPSTTTIPGRILTFKDTRGTFGTNPITFSTAAANQTLENDAIRLTYNDPFGAYSFIAGYDNKWYTIGGSRMYAASISSITTIGLTSEQISSGNITVSTLQFRDTATTSTNTLFSLSTNVYYSSPVSFFSLGPTKAPKPLFTPIRRPFLPNQLANLNFWLDAADPNTQTLQNQYVVQWRDKSANRYSFSNFAQSGRTGPTRVATLNGLNVLTFTSVSNSDPNGQFLQGPAASSMNQNAHTIFIVNNPTTVTGFYWGNTSIIRVQPSSFIVFPYNFDTTAVGYINEQVTNQAGSLNAGLADNSVPNVYNLIVANIVTGAQTVWRNGTQQTNRAYTLSSVLLSPVYIGSFAGTSEFYSGTIAEIIVYSTNLTAAQQQQVEGYLAWKWGLVGNLPSTHPFKNSPP